MAEKIDILVSVINWNSGVALNECVLSFYKWLSKSKYTFLIKVFDNNSTDGSDVISVKDPNRIVITKHDKNLGYLGHAFNLQNVNFDFLFVSNSDIVYKDGNLDDLMAYFVADKNIYLTGFKINKNNNELLQRVIHKIGFPSFTEWLIGRSIFKNAFIFINQLSNIKRIQSAIHSENLEEIKNPIIVKRVSGCVILLKKDCIENVGFFDENFFIYVETIDLLKRIHMYGKKSAYYPLVSFLHHGGLSTCKRKGVNIQHNLSYFYFYKKHYGNFYTYLMCLCFLIDLSVRFLFNSIFNSKALLPKYNTVETLKIDIIFWFKKVLLMSFVNETTYYVNEGD